MKRSNQEKFPIASVKIPTDTPLDRAPGVKILLVDDHKDTRVSIKRLLEIAGHKVLPPSSAREALELASRDKFDLVVSDLELPDLNGHELMTALRSRHGLKGIALSGYGMTGDVERSRQAGFRDHLTKPVSFTQLKELIDKFLYRKK